MVSRMLAPPLTTILTSPMSSSHVIGAVLHPLIMRTGTRVGAVTPAVCDALPALFLARHAPVPSDDGESEAGKQKNGKKQFWSRRGSSYGRHAEAEGLERQEGGVDSLRVDEPLVV